MATIAEMAIRIGADTSDLERGANRAEREINNVGTEMRQIASSLGDSATEMQDRWRDMSEEMQDAYRRSNEALRPFRQQQQEVEYGFFQLAQGMSEYQGSTQDFMRELTELGNRNRQVNDQMMANNNMAMTGFIQGVATMLARSTQSSKIAANFDRMNNPLYRVNNGLLAISGSMERLAARGQPAALALQMLGPTANMKQLNDMTRLITAGLMRFQAVAMAAAVASGILYTALFKAAKGPDPSEVYAKQIEALEAYSTALRERTQEIMETWGLFENIKLNNTTGEQLTKNLEEQVAALQGWRGNLADITRRAGDEFSGYLAEMGPAAAGEIAAISAMSQPELDKYVALWREKFNQSSLEATSELGWLKQETDKKVKELQESLTPLGLALEPMKQAWSSAFTPMVEAFTMVSVPIVNFLTLVGQMITKFNEAHPTIALMIQGFLMLIPALTLILSPLAIGIGLFNGMKAAFASIWPFISPLVTGLAAMSATVWIVAAAIVGLVAGFIYLWNTSEGFRNAIITGWEAIKMAAITVWNFIYTSILVPIINAIVTFVQEKLTQIKAFWNENGTMIMEAAKNVWSVISTVIGAAMDVIVAIMKVLWPVIKAIVMGVWNAIKQVISGAIDVILGIIKFFSALFTGNWKALWEATKQIFSGAINVLLGWLQLQFFGGIGKGIIALGSSMRAGFTAAWNFVKSIFSSGISSVTSIVSSGFNAVVNFITGLGKTFFNAGKGLIEMMANGIKNAASSVLNAVKSLAQKARDFLPFSPAKEGPLSDLDKLDFGNPISDSINRAVPMVKGLLGDLLTVPNFSSESATTNSTNGAALDEIRQHIELIINLDGYEVARATYPHIEGMQTLDYTNSARMAGERT